MQMGVVYKNEVPIGKIVKNNKGIYIFRYNKEYLNTHNPKAISINLPLQNKKFVSNHLFSFFNNMLAEGSIKDIQIHQLRIDKKDDFSRLLKTTKYNTIGSITIEEVKR
jgi:serine/threonine-protein kinase HipA